MILTQALSLVLTKRGDSCAIHFADRTHSFRQLVLLVSRLSYLFKKEIGVGQRVAYIGSNSGAFIPAFFALTNNRSITIPMDPACSDAELLNWLQETSPTHVLVPADTSDRVHDLFRRVKIDVPIIELEKKRGGEYDNSYTVSDNQPEENDTILLLRTRGNGGRNKYCLFSHSQLLSATLGLKKLYRLVPNERVLTTMSWSHPFAFMHGMLFPLLSGSTCVVGSGFEPQTLLKFFQEVHPSRLVDTPEFFQQMLASGGQNKTRLKDVRSITVSLGTLSKEAMEAFTALNLRVLHAYGVGETLWTLAMNDFEAPQSFVMRGLAGNRYKVISPDGTDLEGEVCEGQLCVQTPALLQRFHLDNSEIVQQLTAESIHGTWLRTGDIVRLKVIPGEEPKIFFVSRKNTRETSAKGPDALNIRAIEQAIFGQEEVLDAAVLDSAPYSTGPVHCAVVSKPGNKLSEAELLDRICVRLSPRNKPVSLVYVDAIPRTHNRVDRVELQKAMAAAVALQKNRAA